MREISPGQVFFDYGPVSMVVSARRGGRGDTKLCACAFEVIDDCLKELRPMLGVLRLYPDDIDPEKLRGLPQVMARAVIQTGYRWLTPMAAVAGSIADAVADYLEREGAEKVTANNGGDIAIRLAAGQSLNLGVVYDLSAGNVSQTVRLTDKSGIGGVATSGLGGRSLTTGIASGVTVFSRRCAEADALATLLADRSIILSPAVHTVLAVELDPDSDIADQRVVVCVDTLTEEEKAGALRQVLEEAEQQYQRGSLVACIATVQGKTVTFDPQRILN